MPGDSAVGSGAVRLSNFNMAGSVLGGEYSANTACSWQIYSPLLIPLVSDNAINRRGFVCTYSLGSTETPYPRKAVT